MRPAYERDPYLRELDVEVVRVDTQGGSTYAVLDDTLLFPEGGGQPADHGSLGGVAVLDVRRVDGEIRHYVAAPVTTGSCGLTLDWARRHDYMQQHTAQHLISALAADRLGWRTTSSHLGAERSDIELAIEVGQADPARLAQLESMVVEEILADRGVRARRVPPEAMADLEVRTRGLPAGHSGDVRLVEVEGLDLNTCGGTHLSSTGQIETVKLLGVEPMRGGTRLHWLAGGRVRSRLGDREALAYDLRSLLGTSDAEMVGTVEGKLERIVALERRLRAQERELVVAAVNQLLPCSEAVAAGHFPDATPAFLQQVGRAFVDAAPGGLALLTAGPGREGSFVVAAGADCPLEASVAGARVAKILEGRGGGAAPIFQGKANDLRQRESALAALRALLTG
jgi:Ser-tRNA(Ala) deacylase AlaX